jgi:hypothetical protein
MTQTLQPYLHDDEKLIPLGDVPAAVQEMYGIRIVRQTVYNWIHQGRTTNGDQNRLACVKRVGRFYTCRAMIRDFAEKAEAAVTLKKAR